MIESYKLLVIKRKQFVSKKESDLQLKCKYTLFLNNCKIGNLEIIINKKKRNSQNEFLFFCFFLGDDNYTRLSLILAFLPVSARK